jgi:ABC-type nitrate/sulfonate/bicarbonate transport system substrate-binding protein
MLHAHQLGIKLSEDNFIVVHHLEDAISALKDGQCDYFYWEHWMTLKFVQQGSIRQVGRFSAPWSGFLVVATQKCLDQFPSELNSIIQIIEDEVKDFVQNPSSPSIIAQRFQLSDMEADEWMRNQIWNFSPTLSRNEIQLTIDSLRQIGQPTQSEFPEKIIAPWMQWTE